MRFLEMRERLHRFQCGCQFVDCPELERAGNTAELVIAGAVSHHLFAEPVGDWLDVVCICGQEFGLIPSEAFGDLADFHHRETE